MELIRSRSLNRSLCSPQDRREFDRSLAHARRAQSSSPWVKPVRPANENTQLERRRILTEVVTAAQPVGEKDTSDDTQSGGSEGGTGTSVSSKDVHPTQRSLTEMAAEAKKFCQTEQIAKAAEGTVCYENFSLSAASACHQMREARKKKREARQCDEQDEIDCAELRAMKLLDQQEFFFPEGISRADLQEFIFPEEEAKFGRNDHVDVFDDGKFWEARIEHRRPMTYGEMICRERDGTELEKKGGGPWVYYVALLEIEHKKSYDHIGYMEFELRPSLPQHRERLSNAKKDRSLRLASRSLSVIVFSDVIWAIGQNDPHCGRLQLVRRGEDGEWKEAIIQYEMAERVMNIGIGDSERPSDHTGIADSELKSMDSDRINLKTAELAHDVHGYSPDRKMGTKRVLPLRSELDALRAKRSRSGSNTGSSARTHSPPPSLFEPVIKPPGKESSLAQALRNKIAVKQALHDKIAAKQDVRRRGGGHGRGRGRGGGNRRRGRGRGAPGGGPKTMDFISIPNFARSSQKGEFSRLPPTKSQKTSVQQQDVVQTEINGSETGNSGMETEKDGAAECLERPMSSACEIEHRDSGAVEETTKSVGGRSEVRGDFRIVRTEKELKLLKNLAKLQKDMVQKRRNTLEREKNVKKNALNTVRKTPSLKKPATKKRIGKGKRLSTTNAPLAASSENHELNISIESEEENNGPRKDMEWEMPLPKSRQENDDPNNAAPVSEVVPMTPAMDFCWDRRALDEICKTLGGIYTLSADTIKRLVVLEKKVGKTDMVKMSKEVDILMQFVRKTNGDVTRMRTVQENTLTAILNVTESLSSSSTKSPGACDTSSPPPSFIPVPSPSELAKLAKTPSLHFSPPAHQTRTPDGQLTLAQRAEKALKASPLVLEKTPATASNGKTGSGPLMKDEITPKGAVRSNGPKKRGGGGGGRRHSDQKSEAVSRHLEQTRGASAPRGGGGGASDGDDDDSDEDRRKKNRKLESSKVPSSKPNPDLSDDDDDDGKEKAESNQPPKEEMESGEIKSDEDLEGSGSDLDPTDESDGVKEVKETSSSDDEETKALEQKLKDKQARLKRMQEETALAKSQQESARKAKEARKKRKRDELLYANRKLERQLAEAAREQREMSSSVPSTDLETGKMKKKTPRKSEVAIDLTGEQGAKRMRLGQLPTSPASSSGEEVEGQNDQDEDKNAAAGGPPILSPRHCVPLPRDLFLPTNQLGFFVRLSREVEECTVPVTEAQMSDWTDDHYRAAIGHCQPLTPFQGKDDFNAFQVAARAGTEHPAEVPIVTGIRNELPFYAGGFEQMEEVQMRDPIRYISQQRWERVKKQKIPEVNKAKNPCGQAYVLFRTMLQEDPNWQELLLLDENHVSWSRKYDSFEDVYSNQPRLFSEFIRLFIMGAGFKHLDRPFKEGPSKVKAWCKSFCQTWNKYRLNDKGQILKRYGLQKFAPSEIAKALKQAKEEGEEDESDDGETSVDSSDEDGFSDDSTKPGTSSKKPTKKKDLAKSLLVKGSEKKTTEVKRKKVKEPGEDKSEKVKGAAATIKQKEKPPVLPSSGKERDGERKQKEKPPKDTDGERKEKEKPKKKQKEAEKAVEKPKEKKKEFEKKFEKKKKH